MITGEEDAMLDIHWTLTVQVPQLDALIALGERLMETVQGGVTELQRLNANQAAGWAAINEQLVIIANEVAQFTPGLVTQAQLDTLVTNLRSAADIAGEQEAAVRAASAQIAGIVPDPAP
jgi:hypothetical protein